MGLINYQEYTSLGYNSANAEEVKAMSSNAERAIAAITSYYYEDHDIKQDAWTARVKAYKRAICEQIDFIKATGIGASYESGDDYKSVSIGRLSLTPAGDARTDSLVNGSDVCKEAYALLAHYVLLYRGRGSAEYAATHF